MSQENNIVGIKIKRIREEKGLSIEEVAERSQLTVEQINNLENSAILPSLAPLMKVARALGVRLGTFLDDDTELGPTICRNGEHEASISFSNGNVDARKQMSYFSLAKTKAGRSMEPFIIQIKGEKSEYKLSSHEGEEFIYVLEGNVEIVYGKQTYKLSVGDSIFYDSIINHHVHADGNDAKILAVVYSPL